MFTTIVVLGLVLIVSLWAFSYWCVYRAGKENGYDEAHAEQEAAKVAEQRARTGRHARTQPRTSLVVPKPSPLPWYPLPGPGKPQAGRDSGAGTETFTRLDLPATTGEMAAVTDQYIADMTVNEETFRLGLAT